MSLTLDSTTLRAMRLHNQRIARGAASFGAGASSSADISAGHPGTEDSSTGNSSTGVTRVADTVRHLLAIQAQDFAQAVWAIGLRTPGAVRSDVMAALASGDVVRSAPIRGTLHFLAAPDLRWILRLTAQRTLAGARTRFAELDLDEATFERAAEVAAAELAGGVALSREEFLAVLRSAGISTEGQRGYHLIFNLSHRALICWGPPRGNQQALVLVDEWIPNAVEPDRSAALREFALRYFTGHGPATERDFAWWSKLTLADARAAIALARDELTELSLDGVTFWAGHATAGPASLGPASLDPAGKRSAALAEPAEPAALREVYTLPGFDEYLLGYQDRSHVLDADHLQRIIPGKNGIFLPTLVSKGKVIGTWRKGDVATATSATAELFAPLTARETAALRRSENAYERFMAG
jgi:hypothetical protein